MTEFIQFQADASTIANFQPHAFLLSVKKAAK
jgi:hypothetical protein